MEAGFGFDFSRVRIHRDARAAESARALGARAYTVGHHVVLGRGESPDADRGRLLAHELAHVVQQRRASALPRSGIRSPSWVTPTTSLVQRQAEPGAAASAQVELVEISMPSNQIRFHTRQGIHRYQLEHRGLRAGEYDATVRLRGNRVDFTLIGMVGDFEFSWRIEPGQPNPATFLHGQSAVRFRISAEAFPPVQSSAAQAPADSDAIGLTPEEAQRRCEADDLRVMTFPFRGTRFGAAPIMARRDGEFIVISQPVYVLANDDFRAQTRTLPVQTFLGGVRLRPNQIVRVHVYEPRWYHLNITGSTSGDIEREFCVTGEQMLELAAASTRATLLNIGLTAFEAATLFIPVGRLASAAAQPLARGARTVTAAAMLGTADVAPTALAGVASRAAVVAVEEQAVTRVAGQAVTHTVSQTVVRAGTEAATSAAPGVAGRAAAGTLPRVAGGTLVDVAGRGALASGAHVAGGAVRPSAPEAPGGGGAGGVPSAPVPAPPAGSTGAVRVVLASGETLIVDSQTARALEQGARGAIPAGQEALQLAYSEALRLTQAQTQAARGVTITPRTLQELGAHGPIHGVLQTLPPVTASAAEQVAVLGRLAQLGVGGASGVADRQIVMQALLSPRAAGAVPTLVTADRQIINGLARAAGVDPARLGRFATVAEYFHYTQGSRTFAVNIEGHLLRVHPVQIIRGGL